MLWVFVIRKIKITLGLGPPKDNDRLIALTGKYMIHGYPAQSQLRSHPK